MGLAIQSLWAKFIGAGTNFASEKIHRPKLLAPTTEKGFHATEAIASASSAERWGTFLSSVWQGFPFSVMGRLSNISFAYWRIVRSEEKPADTRGIEDSTRLTRASSSTHKLSNLR